MCPCVNSGDVRGAHLDTPHWNCIDAISGRRKPAVTRPGYTRSKGRGAPHRPSGVNPVGAVLPRLELDSYGQKVKLGGSGNTPKLRKVTLCSLRRHGLRQRHPLI